MSSMRSRLLPLVLLALAVLPTLTVTAARAASQFEDGSWSSLDAAVPAPGARREFTAIYDKANQRYVIFAGADRHAPDLGSLHDEIYSLSLGGSPAWSQIVPAGSGPGRRHSPQWGYDPARNRMLVFGGYGFHYTSSDEPEYLNDIWELALDGTPTWTELTPSGTAPSGRLAGAAVYDPLRQRFVGFGGTISLPVDTWQLDLSGTPAWSTIPTDSTGPPGSYGMTAIYDPRRDRMISFGGSISDGYFGVHDDVWQLDLSQEPPVWSELGPFQMSPVARRTGTSVYDPLRNRMIIFAGWDSSLEPTAFLNDTWALSLGDAPFWYPLSPEGGPPTRRDAMAAVYDPAGDRMVVFGGWSGEEMLDDTWFLSWGGTGRVASMTASGEGDYGVARVSWNVQDATGPHAAVYRRKGNTPWSSLATVEADAAGNIAFEDYGVRAGDQYGYMIVVSSERGEAFGGETWVDVPATLGVGGQGTAAFSLGRVSPNPVLHRFSVSFALPTAEPARLELLDLGGRRVLSRDVTAFGAGSHRIELAGARDSRPGTYFLRLTQAGKSQAVRVVIRGGSGAE